MMTESETDDVDMNNLRFSQVRTESGRLVGYEIQIEDDWFCIFADQSLPGVRVGRFVPDYNSLFVYREMSLILNCKVGTKQ